MNGSLIFVLILVTIVMCTRIIVTLIKEKKAGPDSSAELEETLTKIDTLEERIKVLERIITENRFDLKSEIDSL